jgi:hypothetical protein
MVGTMTGTMKRMNAQFLGLRCVAWRTHLWRQWEGCSMLAFQQQEDADHVVINKTIIGRSPEVRILVSAMDLIILVMAEEDMVVVVVLISIISVVATVLISIISVANVVHTSIM